MKGAIERQKARVGLCVCCHWWLVGNCFITARASCPPTPIDRSPGEMTEFSYRAGTPLIECSPFSQVLSSNNKADLCDCCFKRYAFQVCCCCCDPQIDFIDPDSSGRDTTARSVATTTTVHLPAIKTICHITARNVRSILATKSDDNCRDRFQNRLKIPCLPASKSSTTT